MNPLSVLVVDDSEVMRRVVARALRMSGVPIAEVREAADGEEGLALLRAGGVDLALVDINMPRMNGEEMIGRIRRDPVTAALPVVVVSTERNAERIQRLRDLKVGFVQKPFAPVELRRSVTATLAGAHA